MVPVTISYNVYLDTMTIHIDGCPIPPISHLTRFQTMPFEKWCPDIFQAIAEEVNDQFSLLYIGRPCESRILGQFMATTSSCSFYSNQQPSISGNALTRLKKLSSLCQSGLLCDRFTVPLHIYTDMPETALQSIIGSHIPKLAYCRIAVKQHPLHEASRHNEALPAFVLTAGSPPAVRLPHGGCVLCVSDHPSAAACRDGCFTESVPGAEISARFAEYLELLYLPHVLRKAVKSIHIADHSPFFPSVTVLDKTEPQTLVTLPASVEYGQTVPVKVQTVPAGSAPANLIYRISDESVVQMTPEGIKGVGTGEAVVEVYINGQATKICSGKVVSYRRNRIRNLRIKQGDLQVWVGDRVRLDYSFEPTDADNESSIRLISSDGTVAAPEHGTTFVARTVGSCRMIMQAEKVSAEIHVQVFPRLEGLTLDVQAENLSVGAIAPVKITRTPETATLDKLVYTVSPPSLGIYDPGTRSFCAREAGSGTLTVSNQAGTVKAVRNISVKNAKPTGGGCLLTPMLLTLGALAVHILTNIM